MIVVNSTAQIIKRFKELNQDIKINIGASSVLLFNNGVIFSLVKPTYWRTETNGLLSIDFSGVGGSVEKDETPYQCVLREINEEIRISKKNLLSPNKVGKILYIQKQKKQFIKMKTGNKEPTPICIFEIKVPKQYNQPNQNTQSCLLLFVYLMQLKSNNMPCVRENEDIPGLVHVKGTFLKKFLEGIRVESHAELSSNDYTLHIRTKYKKLFPKKFILSPKFTPRAIFSSGLQYKDFLSWYSD